MVDIDKIKWREVTEFEYNQAHFRTARRTTIIDFGGQTRYELGTPSVELPTKPGAVVAPVGPNEDGYVPYVLGIGGEWFEFDTLDGGNPYRVPVKEIIEFIEDGTFYIAFGGYDD